MTDAPAVARALLAIVVLVAPGWLAARAAFPERDALSRAALGAALGLAAAIWLALLCAQLHLTLFFAAWPLLAIAAGVAAWRTRATRPAPAAARDERLLAGIVAVSAAPRLAIAAIQRLPKGWDPSFHLLLAEKLSRLDRAFSDWTPFETLPLHYPLGPHALLVVISRAAHVPLAAAFTTLVALAGTLAVAQVFALARAVTRDTTAALCAAAAQGLVVVLGGMDYADWGGLPNALGMALLLGALQIAIEEDRAPRRTTAALALLLAAIPIAHHHVFVVAAFVMLAIAIARARDARRFEIPRAAAIAAVLASFFLVPYALRASELRGTGVLLYDEEFLGPVRAARELGVAFTVLVIAGAAAWIRDRVRPSRAFLAPLLALFALFVVCEYVWRVATRSLFGVEHVAFTPSRFLTDAAPLLAVIAGAGAAAIGRVVRAPPVAAPIAVVLLGATNAGHWASMAEPGPNPVTVRVCEWVRDHTPPDAIVLTDYPWAAYLCWRRTRQAPIPASENDPGATEKAAWMREIDAGRIPPALADTTIVDIRRSDDTGGRRVLHEEGGLAVVAVSPP